MSQMIETKPMVISPLVLADRLLTMARDADEAGMPASAERLLRLAFRMYAERPMQ